MEHSTRSTQCESGRIHGLRRQLEQEGGAPSRPFAMLADGPEQAISADVHDQVGHGRSVAARDHTLADDGHHSVRRTRHGGDSAPRV
jgi:hypothetical protein